ncbi:hypothetical protein BH24ACT19_BH24ACT19_14670 [soil metagenome]
MGSRIGRRRGITLIVVSLTVLLAYVPALAAQATTVPAASGDQNGSLPVGPPGDPPAGPGGAVSGDQSGSQPEPPGELGVCDHAPGEFLIGYDSEEALRAAPQENVVNTLDSILVQHVVYDEIKNEPDPAIRSAAEEAKRQELEARPGVNYVEYNCSATAEAQQFAPPPADCGECGANIGRAAAQIIGGSADADGKTAYEVALEAARSVDEGNVALAAENGEEDMGVAGTGEEDVDAAGTGEEDTGDAEATETEEETTAGGNTSKDTGEETVNGAVASGESRVNSPLLALGGGVLLVAGVFMARRVFGA